MNPTDVVAAIIKKGDHYLLAKRSKEKYMGLKWEFPGGKVEQNETFKDALSREILEELNVNVDIHNKIAEESYQDDQINIVLSEHEAIEWVKKQDFLKYEFVPGDGDITSLI